MYRFEPDIDADQAIDCLGAAGDHFETSFRLGMIIDEDHPERNSIVLMSVCFLQGFGFDEYPKSYDFRFGIRHHPVERNWLATPMDFSSEASKRFIPAGSRMLILERVLSGLVALVTEINPSVITMSTFDTHLPDHAMKKYAAIEDTLNTCGYSISMRYLSEEGRTRWLFQRNAAPLETDETME